MMKSVIRVKPIIFLITLFLAVGGFSQTVKWGPVNQISPSYYPRVIGEDAEKIYAYGFNGEAESKIKLKVFDKSSMSRSLSKQMILRHPIERIGIVKDQFIIFTSDYSAKSKSYNLMAQIVDSDSLKASESFNLFEMKVDNSRYSGKFNIAFSQDRSKILLHHRSYSKKFRQYSNTYRLLDANLNVLIERKDIVNEGEQRDSKSEFLINNEGSLFYLSRRKGKRYVVSFDANKDYEKWEEPIDFTGIGMKPGSEITNVHFKINATGDLVLIGYYSESDGGFGGYFFLSIDGKSKETKYMKLGKFDKEFTNKFAKEKAPSIKKFDKVKILNKSDGGIVLIGEEYFEGYKSFWHNDLIVINFSAEGEVVWAHKIGKRQKNGIGGFGNTYNFGNYSYTAGINDNKVIIVFYDHKNNLPKSDTDPKLKPLKKMNKSYVAIHSIDLQSGGKEKKALSEVTDKRLWFSVRYSRQPTINSDMILLGFSNFKSRLGLLEF